MEQIRVRMAPSPTGEPHLGTARTAIFNYVFAQKYGGVFILRIEDTDKERSKKEYELNIVDGLKWLGTPWDEGPVRQSERTEIYKTYLEKLLKEKKGYYCFCSKEELEQKKQEAAARGEMWHYPGTCRDLDKEKIKELLKIKDFVIRIKTKNEDIKFKDIIRGEIIFPKETLEDFIIAKDLSSPLYNFAAAIDDYEMKISHVIRGEEHIANTPKQIIIQDALGFSRPYYAHLPLILAQDKSKLSKRHGAFFTIKELKEKGYLPEALFNFLALLGWHPKKDREVLSKQELINEFELERVQRAGAAFNLNKLDWLNGYYLRKKADEEILKLIKPLLEEKTGRHDLLKAVAVGKERARNLNEVAQNINNIFNEIDYPAELLVWKKSNKQDALEYLQKCFKILFELNESDFKSEKVKSALAEIEPAEDLGRIYWPLRVALSGQKASAPPFDLAQILGKEKTVALIKKAVSKLKPNLNE